MAFISWDQPMQWIITDETNAFTTVPQTDARLAQIHQPVCVVVIVGSGKTGKSYLMNRLASTHGFAVNNDINLQTKGIWILCLQHPRHQDRVLMLIDTEGLNFHSREDIIYASLARLLSSTLVLNSIGRIDEFLIGQLDFLARLTARNDPNEGDEAKGKPSNVCTQNVSNLVVALRDFTLRLQLNGLDVTPTEYLNHFLAPREGDGGAVFEYNQKREAIRRAFNNITCFTFTQPVDDIHNIAQLGDNLLPEESLSPRFREQSHEFLNYVLSTVPVKTLANGQRVTGETLQNLAAEFIRVVNLGDVSIPNLLQELLAQPGP